MKQELTIGWLYPDLMSTYGDRGNILVLTKRCEWRDIAINVVPISQETSLENLKKVDMLFGGGAQDREQSIVMNDLQKKKDAIKEIIEKGKPGLFVCGSPQLMGKYYEPAEGERVEGVGIFDMVSKHPGPKADRLIGNIVAKVHWDNLGMPTKHDIIVGFENHGGRTYLGKDAKPFAQVIKGNGNNGKDDTEGVVYKNAVGCYFHGPLLPKNPSIADWLIQRALAVKYDGTITLAPLDDTLELQAQKTIALRLGIGV